MVQAVLSLIAFFAFAALTAAHVIPELNGAAPFGGAIFYLAQLVLLAVAFGLLACGLRSPGALPQAAHLTPLPRGFDPLLYLRFMACVMVVLGHGFHIFLTDDARTRSLEAGRFLLLSSPSVGLWIFFVLSGYLMGKGFFRGRYPADAAGLRHFLTNRALRIVPLAWVSVLIVAAVSYRSIFEPVHLGDLARILFFDYDAIQEITPDGPLWSLSTEVQFYLMVPALYLVFGNLKMRHEALFTVLFLTLLGEALYRAIAYTRWPEAAYRPLLANLDFFLAGFLLNHAVLRLRSLRYAPPSGVPLGCFLMLLLYGVGSFVSAAADLNRSSGWPALMYVFGPIAVILLTGGVILSFECAAAPASSLSLQRILKKGEIFGILTYAIYVWHLPLIQLFWWFHPTPASWGEASVRVGALMLVSLAVAFLSVQVLEKPFERLKTYGSRPPVRPPG